MGNINYLKKTNEHLIVLCDKYNSGTVKKYSKALSFLSVKHIPNKKNIYEVLFFTYGVNTYTLEVATNLAQYEIYCKINGVAKNHLEDITKSVLNNYLQLL